MILKFGHTPSKSLSAIS